MIIRDQHFGAQALQDLRLHDVLAMPTVVITRTADAAMMHSVMSRALICDMPFWARMSAGACSLQRHDPLTEFRLHGIVV